MVVLEDLVDVDNVGAAIRNAAAFDADAIVLSPRAADPFYRKAIRVSMGTVFFLPIVRCRDWPGDLLAPLPGPRPRPWWAPCSADGAIPLAAFRWPERVALLFGAEGPGLSAAGQGRLPPPGDHPDGAREGRFPERRHRDGNLPSRARRPLPLEAGAEAETERLEPVAGGGAPGRTVCSTTAVSVRRASTFITST